MVFYDVPIEVGTDQHRYGESVVPVPQMGEFKSRKYGSSETACCNLLLIGVEIVGTIRTRTGICWRLFAITCTVAMPTCYTLLRVLLNDDKYIVSVHSPISSSSSAKCSVINDFCASSSNNMLASV